MNCKPNIAIVYTSVSGNTKELAEIIQQMFLDYDCSVQLFHIKKFPCLRLWEFDAIVIGTYTWGSGEIPNEMCELFYAFESQQVEAITTGVFGTGDSFYPNFCGAVDHFRDMLYVHTNLAVTLKVELNPQLQDYKRCLKFAQLLIERVNATAKPIKA